MKSVNSCGMIIRNVRKSHVRIPAGAEKREFCRDLSVIQEMRRLHFQPKQERKMYVKRIFAVVLALALMLTLCGSAFAAETKAALTLEVKKGLGETIVTVYLQGGADVTNGHISVRYDADAVQLVKAEKSDAYALASLNIRTAGTIGLAWVGSRLTDGKTALMTLHLRSNSTVSGNTELSVADLGIYAAGEKLTVSGAKTTLAGWSNPYVDIDGHWAEEEILRISRAGIFNGVEKNYFEPETAMNRAMFVTVLYRMAGSPAVNGSSAFVDVPKNDYYTKAVVWATKNGITEGVSATEFEPMETISREQMMTMLFRYAEKIEGRDVSSSASLDAFTDSAAVNTWAVKAMRWAVAEGIVQGYPDGTIQPAADTTRAETATLLCRYLGL